MLDAGLNFDTCLDDFGAPNGTPNGFQNRLRIGLGPPSRPRDAKGRPEASREQFVCLQGAIWSHFGVILEPFGGYFRTILRHRLPLFTPPPLFFVALVTCLPCHSCYHGVPDTQGRRVPALALTIIIIRIISVSPASAFSCAVHARFMRKCILLGGEKRVEKREKRE